jgi:hypothetical protein
MRTLRVLLVMVLLVVTAGCATTGTPADTGRYSLTLVTQHDHAVEDGQTTVGPLVLAGGTLTVREGAEHRGDVLTLAGRMVVQGQVSGDVVALGGEVSLAAGAVVTGDVLQVDGSLDVDPLARVQGRVVTDVDAAQVWGEPASGPTFTQQLVTALMGALVAGAFAWGLTRVATRPVRRVARAAEGYPVVSGALGTLVLLTAPALLVSMAFTVVLLPLAVVLLLPLAGLTAYGLVCVGQAVGQRLLHRRAPRLRASEQAAVGTAGLVLVLALLGMLPLVGLLSLFTAGAVGTGAALLTGLGTHGYAPPAGLEEGEALRQGQSG